MGKLGETRSLGPV